MSIEELVKVLMDERGEWAKVRDELRCDVDYNVYVHYKFNGNSQMQGSRKQSKS